MIDRQTRQRAVGLGLLLLMLVHTLADPERGAWVLLSACDVASLATAVGLIVGWRAAVAVAFLFQVSISVPAFFVGMATRTYTPNATSVAIHLLPPLAGGWAIFRRRLPRHAVAIAFAVYALVMGASVWLSPPALNVNLVFTVWPPLRRLTTARLPGLLLFHGVGPLLLLSAGAAALRRWWPGALSSPPAPSPGPRPDRSG